MIRVAISHSRSPEAMRRADAAHARLAAAGCAVNILAPYEDYEAGLRGLVRPPSPPKGYNHEAQTTPLGVAEQRTRALRRFGSQVLVIASNPLTAADIVDVQRAADLRDRESGALYEEICVAAPTAAKALAPDLGVIGLEKSALLADIGVDLNDLFTPTDLQVPAYTRG